VRTSRPTRTVPLVAAVACSMGCASTLVVSDDDYFAVACGTDVSRVYAGPLVDAQFALEIFFGTYAGGIPTPWMLRALALLDLPLSLAADTALLPVSAPLEVRDWLVCGSAPSDEKIIIQKSGEEILIESED